MSAGAWLFVALLAPDASAPAAPPAALKTEAFQAVADPALLPEDVRAAWARALGQQALDVAAPGTAFNTSDVGGGTRHQLILAAVSPRYAVVHYYAGGIGLTRQAMAFSRGDGEARLSYRGRAEKEYKEPKKFLDAIHHGRLWRR